MRRGQDDFIFVMKVADQVMIGVTDEMRSAFENGVQAVVLAVIDDDISADIGRVAEMEAELTARMS